MENTQSNKEKFFAQYWGQKVGKVNSYHQNVISKVCEANISSIDYLELKPLSSITDEDAEKVRTLQMHFPINLSMTFDLKDEFMVCLESKYSDNYEVVNVNSVDYLRLKGYALPWMGLSVEKLQEYGWVKLKSE